MPTFITSEKNTDDILPLMVCTIVVNGITEYSELGILCMGHSEEWFDAYAHNAEFLSAFISSFKRRPDQVAKRLLEQVDKGIISLSDNEINKLLRTIQRGESQRKQQSTKTNGKRMY